MLDINEVFGVNNINIRSYLWRKEVDGKLKMALNENKHIVLYGASKQGKSSSIRENIKKDDYVQINCDINSGSTDVYKSLLRKIGITFKIVSEEANSSEERVSFGGRLKTIIAILGTGEVEAGGEVSSNNSKLDKFESIQYNLDIANDVCEVLESIHFSKYIVLENFHYLDDEVQNKLAFDLRTFHDRGFYFIIVGIWKDKNRLVQYNGELADRIVEIPVEPWTRNDFHEVARKGCMSLNILISQDIINEVIEISFGSIGIFQELLKLYCIHSSVTRSVMIFRNLTNQEPLDKAIHDKAEQYETRFLRALEDIATASSRKDGLFIPYYFIQIIVNSSINELMEGIHRDMLTERLIPLHHTKEVHKGVITYHLHQLTSLQCKKNISPPIFDYDRINKYIRVIDPTLLFFLNYRPGKEIMEEIIDPRIGILE